MPSESGLVEFVVDSIDSVLRLNYDFVSTLVAFLNGLAECVAAAFTASKLAIADLFDQYALWCMTVVNALEWCLSQVASVGYGVRFLLSAILHSMCRLFSLILSGVDCISQSLDFALDNVTRLIDLPVILLELIGRMVCTLFEYLWHGVITVLLIPWRACKYVALSPYRIGKHIVVDTVEAPQDALFGLVVCLIILYLWRIGLLPYIQRKLFEKVKAFVNWFWRTSLYTAEYIVTITSPQLAITIKVIKWLYRPILWLLTTVWNALVRRPRPSIIEVQSNADCIADTNERLLCVVCQTKEKVVMTMPCRHLVLCRPCATRVMSNIGGRKCPICRAHVQTTVDVYL